MTTANDSEADAAEVADKLPREIADALHADSMTLPQALIAEAFGLVDVLNLPEKRWSPSLTPLGREVREVLEEGALKSGEL